MHFAGDEGALASVEQLTATVAALQAECEDLLLKNAELEKSNRFLSDFIATVSHEIRTPMTAIIGFADLLYEDGDISLAPPQRIQTIDTIQRNSRYLLRVVNDILDLSKIEAGKFQIFPSTFSLIDLIADIRSLMEVRAHAKDLKFEVEYVGSVPEKIETDPTRLKQILVNLLGNAIKFTEIGGVRLLVRCVEEDVTRLQCSVIDTGIGLTDEQQAKLFTSYAQFHGRQNDRHVGTGLGLYISRRLAEMMGGTIEVESRVGEGSMFRASVAIDIPADCRLLDDAGAATVARPEFRHQVSSAVPQLPASFLIVEDGADNRRLLEHMLFKAGASSESVENGQEGVDRALSALQEGNPFDVILMDMQMPVMDGLQATRLLRKANYQGAIVAITAHAMDGDRQRFIEAGCDDYIAKPIDRGQLMQTILQFVGLPKSS